MARFAFVSVPAAPVRRKPNHRSEMVNQLLFGEALRLLKEKGSLWVKVRSLHDGYEGWMTRTLLQPVQERELDLPGTPVTVDLLNELKWKDQTMFVPAGASLPYFENGQGKMGEHVYQFSGNLLRPGIRPPSAEWLQELVQPWLNVPYLWGGRSPLGVDCSGFTQVIFKQMGINLPRDAWQQAQEGWPVKKFADAIPGDLAFFDNQEDIVHVGILLGEGKLLHASGRVRIDPVNKKGISSKDSGTAHTRLRAVRRYW